MNYRIKILQPDGQQVFEGQIDLTEFGLHYLINKIRDIDLGNPLYSIKIKEVKKI